MDMLARLRVALLIGAVGAGSCTSFDGLGSDGSPSDMTENGPGLVVPFTTKSPIPGPVGHDAVVSQLLFRVANLRVIGDAGPGDTRTTRDRIELEWKAGASPATVRFADAPSGLYSKVSMQADGETVVYSYEIAGTVALKNASVDFLIHDLQPLEISMDTSVALDPGKRAVVGIRLELESAFDGLDFDKLPVDQGRLVLGTEDHQMQRFRKRLSSAFVAKVDSSN